jgi:hypothetical protein
VTWFKPGIATKKTSKEKKNTKGKTRSKAYFENKKEQQRKEKYPAKILAAPTEPKK